MIIVAYLFLIFSLFLSFFGMWFIFTHECTNKGIAFMVSVFITSLFSLIGGVLIHP